MYYALLLIFLFSKLEALKLKQEGALLDLQEFPEGRSTLALTTPSYTHTHTHSSQCPARTQGWEAES